MDAGTHDRVRIKPNYVVFIHSPRHYRIIPTIPRAHHNRSQEAYIGPTQRHHNITNPRHHGTNIHKTKIHTSHPRPSPCLPPLPNIPHSPVPLLIVCLNHGSIPGVECAVAVWDGHWSIGIVLCQKSSLVEVVFPVQNGGVRVRGVGKRGGEGIEVHKS